MQALTRINTVLNNVFKDCCVFENLACLKCVHCLCLCSVKLFAFDEMLFFRSNIAARYK